MVPHSPPCVINKYRTRRKFWVPMGMSQRHTPSTNWVCYIKHKFFTLKVWWLWLSINNHRPEIIIIYPRLLNFLNKTIFIPRVFFALKPMYIPLCCINFSKSGLLLCIWVTPYFSTNSWTAILFLSKFLFRNTYHYTSGPFCIHNWRIRFV